MLFFVAATTLFLSRCPFSYCSNFAKCDSHCRYMCSWIEFSSENWILFLIVSKLCPHSLVDSDQPHQRTQFLQCKVLGFRLIHCLGSLLKMKWLQGWVLCKSFQCWQSSLLRTYHCPMPGCGFPGVLCSLFRLHSHWSFLWCWSASVCLIIERVGYVFLLFILFEHVYQDSLLQIKCVVVCIGREVNREEFLGNFDCEKSNRDEWQKSV